MIKILAFTFLLSAIILSILVLTNPKSIPEIIGNAYSPASVNYATEIYAKNVYGENRQDGLVIMRVGEKLNFYVNTKNAGKLGAVRTSSTVADGGFEFLVPALGAGRSVTKSFPYTCEKEGRFNVNAYADYYNSIAENDETDNNAYIHVSCVNFG